MTPAARIAVLHFLNVQQCAFFLQQRNDNIVRFEDVNAIQSRVSTGR
ncbi:MAG: hypothetical protein ACLRP3_21190 [Escherichia sp.]